jgi:hypothetical protein
MQRLQQALGEKPLTTLCTLLRIVDNLTNGIVDPKPMVISSILWLVIISAFFNYVHSLIYHFEHIGRFILAQIVENKKINQAFNNFEL